MLRLLHLVLWARSRYRDEERAEIERLSASGTAAADRLRVAEQCGPGRGTERGHRRHRTVALASRQPHGGTSQTIEAAEIVSRAYEEIHAQAV